MARKPSVNYWSTVGTWTDPETGEKRKGAFAVRINGKPIILAEGPDDSRTQGPVYSAATKKFGEVLCMGNVNKAGDGNMVYAIFQSYLDHIDGKLAPQTVRMHRNSFNPFIAYKPEGFDKPIGQLPVIKLTHKLVYDYIRMMEQPRKVERKLFGTDETFTQTVSWTAGTVRTFLASLSVAFNWAARSGVISKNPLAGIDMPPAPSRGEEALLGSNDAEIEAAHAKILAAAPKAFKDIIQVLKDTGCREGELCNATADDFDAAHGALIFRRNIRRTARKFAHKTAHKGKERVIFLTGRSLDIVRRLVEKYPTGPLFRTLLGAQMTEDDVTRMFWKLADKVGMPGLTSYRYRHTFATEALKSGKLDIDTLAELMGNSPQTIRKHYAHLLKDKSALRAKLEAFKMGNGALLLENASVSDSSDDGTILRIDPTQVAAG